MTKRFWIFVVGALLVGTVAAGVLIVVVLRGGVSARSEPSAVEATLARKVRHWFIPAAARALTNPVPVNADVLARARAHFADHCASCHGNNGAGATPLGKNLYPRAPDMRLPATQRLGDGELFWIIENGIRFTGMPAWSVPGEENETWALVHFIRHLPNLKGQELRQMEALNPRSAEEWREREEEERFLRGEDEQTTERQGVNRPAEHHQH